MFRKLRELAAVLQLLEVHDAVNDKAKTSWFLTHMSCNCNAVIAYGEFVTKLSQFAFSNQSFAVRERFHVSFEAAGINVSLRQDARLDRNTETARSVQPANCAKYHSSIFNRASAQRS